MGEGGLTNEIDGVILAIKIYEYGPVTASECKEVMTLHYSLRLRL